MRPEKVCSALLQLLLLILISGTIAIVLQAFPVEARFRSPQSSDGGCQDASLAMDHPANGGIQLSSHVDNQAIDPLTAFQSAKQSVEEPSWLVSVNQFRAMAHVQPLVENHAWSYGAWLHSRYMVMNDTVGHLENESNAWYTSEGATAAAASDVYASWDPNAPDEQSIIAWMTAPFHQVGIIDPYLHSTGFGSYGGEIGSIHHAAGLDVIRGREPNLIDGRFPIMFPAPGERLTLRSYGGGEYPDPLASCPGYNGEVGSSIVLMLDHVPDVTAFAIWRDGLELEVCEFDENTYSNPDLEAQRLGRATLASRHAVILMPREPLLSGMHEVSITANGQGYSWSFAFGRAGCTPSQVGACGGAPVSGDRTPERAFDHNGETYFQGSHSEDAWDLYYNFGTSVFIESLEVDYFSLGHIAEITGLSVSDDGENWISIGILDSKDPISIPIGGDYQYIWLAMRGKNPSTGNAPAINEVTITSNLTPRNFDDSGAAGLPEIPIFAEALPLLRDD